MQGALKPGRNPHKPHPANCLDCGVPILSRKRFATPPEGYVWHQGRGLCGKCYSRKRPLKDLGITNCRDCGRPLRLQNEKLSDKPGTLKHAGRGLCNTHYEIRAKNGTLGEMPTIGHPKLPTPVAADPETLERRAEYTRQGFERYILARRERLRRQACAALLRRAA